MSNNPPEVLEQWKDIKGYEGYYQISSLGRLKSLARSRVGNGHKSFVCKERIMKPGNVGKRRNYLGIILSKDGSQQSYKMHRLVATYFVDNKFNKPEVNHKDGNPSNNAFWNLEWVTTKENIIHSFKMGLSKPCDSEHYQRLGGILKKLLSTKVEHIGTGKEYASITEASKKTDTGIAIIHRHINNQVKMPLWKKAQ